MGKNTKGQSLVELSLVLPLFLFVFLGIIDFGFALHSWSTLNEQCVQAARTGARRLNSLVARNVVRSTTHTDVSEVKAAFWRFQSPLMASESYQNLNFNGVGDTSQEISVSAEYRLQFLTPFLGSMFGSSGSDGKLTIQASAKAKKE